MCPMSPTRPPRSPRPSRQPGPSASPRTAPASPPPASVSDEQREALQQGLDQIPAPLEPLDISALDGYLCGILLQPQAIALAQWLPTVFDIDGRNLPKGFDASPLRALIEQRYRELNHAIETRQWFDPWIFELEEDVEDEEDEVAVFPWVAGFATALTLFPGLSDLAAGAGSEALIEPLALIYRHLDPEDLEDADDILAEIETLEPPADLSAAVEELVRATLLLADVTRPVRKPSAARPKQRGPGR